MGTLFRRTADVFAAPLEDTTLLLNTMTGFYHGLNPVGARIWDLSADPTNEEELVARLVCEFAVTPEDCRRETSAFLAKLRGRNLLTDDC